MGLGTTSNEAPRGSPRASRVRGFRRAALSFVTHGKSDEVGRFVGIGEKLSAAAELCYIQSALVETLHFLRSRICVRKVARGRKFDSEVRHTCYIPMYIDITNTLLASKLYIQRFINIQLITTDLYEQNIELFCK